MKLAIHFPNFTLPGGPEAIAPALAGTARAAEDSGVAAMTLMDHWFQMESMGDPRQPMLEGYTSLGYLAGITERLRLGLLVTGVTYRYPGLLAKIVATLDVLSGGRAFLGIGAAWYEQEHRALGVPYPPLKERFERLEETLEICKQMWSDDDGPYDGKHYRLGSTLCSPRPLQAPRPPILIGGSGEQKTLRLVAQHADACNIFDIGPEGVQHKIDVLKGHCDEIGRDLSEIEITIIARGASANPDEFLAAMAPFAKMGVAQVWVGARPPDPTAWVGDFAAAVVPRLSDL